MAIKIGVSSGPPYWDGIIRYQQFQRVVQGPGVPHKGTKPSQYNPVTSQYHPHHLILLYIINILIFILLPILNGITMRQ